MSLDVLDISRWNDGKMRRKHLKGTPEINAQNLEDTKAGDTLDGETFWQQ